MTEDGVIGIDLGTGSVKVLVADLTGAVRAIARRGYPTAVRPLDLAPGRGEADPDGWLVAVAEATREAVGRSGIRPIGVGFSGQMHGLVLTAADGRAVRPALQWTDARALPQVQLYGALSDPVLARLGGPLVPGMAGPLLAWLTRHEPDAVAAARWALQPKDWLRLRLTGQAAGEPSDASATLLYDLMTDAWSSDVVSALEVDPRLLPPLLTHGGAPAGTLTPEAAGLLGLPAGIVVAAGAGDTAAAIHGSALREPGEVQLTVGTGVQIVTPVERLPRPLPSRPTTHLYRTAAARGWYAMAAGLNGGSTLGWVCTLLGMSLADLNASLDSPLRQDDPVFVPHLHGERTPWLDTELRGAWTGLSARHTRVDLARAALAGVAVTVHDAYAALLTSGALGPSNTSGSLDPSGALDPSAGQARPVRLAGGGTADPRWRRLLADALGRPLTAVDVADASGLGAALLAAEAAGCAIPAELPHGDTGADKGSDTGSHTGSDTGAGGGDRLIDAEPTAAGTAAFADLVERTHARMTALRAL
jgi:xylulokinase